MNKLIVSFLCAFVLAVPAFCVVSESDLVVSPSVAWQGKTLTVRLVSAEGVSQVRGRFLDQEFVCYKTDNGFRGVVGVPIDQKPSQYDLFLYIYSKDGIMGSFHRGMKVWATRFPLSRFWLKPAKRKLMRRELIDQEWARIERVLRVESPKQHWEGRFSAPVEGKVSQGFGHLQVINGRRGGNHRGVDFAVLNGTPVKAPNHGQVVFAERLKAFGGTLVLDHGQGIYTLYFHLSRIDPVVGQMAKKAEVIGLSGNSGISSGPHLHWGMSVHNLRVDPMQWVKYEI